MNFNTNNQKNYNKTEEINQTEIIIINKNHSIITIIQEDRMNDNIKMDTSMVKEKENIEMEMIIYIWIEAEAKRQE